VLAAKNSQNKKKKLKKLLLKTLAKIFQNKMQQKKEVNLYLILDFGSCFVTEACRAHMSSENPGKTGDQVLGPKNARGNGGKLGKRRGGEDATEISAERMPTNEANDSFPMMRQRPASCVLARRICPAHWPPNTTPHPPPTTPCPSPVVCPPKICMKCEIKRLATRYK